MNKLIVSVVQNDYADEVVDALLEADYRTTRLASTGGFLRKGNTTLLIGAQENQVDAVLDIIRATDQRVSCGRRATWSCASGCRHCFRARPRRFRTVLAE